MDEIIVSPSSPDAEQQERIARLVLPAILLQKEYENCELKVNEFRRLTDGVTNMLWRCTLGLLATKKSQLETSIELKVLVRIFGSGTEEIIDRNTELENMQRLFALGLAAKVYGTFGNGCVYEYIEGKAVEPEELRSLIYAEPIATHLAKWHSIGTDEERLVEPSFLSVTRDWLSKIPKTYNDPKKDAVLAALNPEQLRAEFEQLGPSLSSIGSPVVFSHNDLLGPNIIVKVSDGAGEEVTKVDFIDYEYGSFNARGFDFGNHWCEYAGFDLEYDSTLPDVDARKTFARAYLAESRALAAVRAGINESDQPVSDAEVNALVVEGTKFMLASHFFWATWALIQAQISEIDFDYIGYARKRFEYYYRVKDATLSFSL